MKPYLLVSESGVHGGYDSEREAAFERGEQAKVGNYLTVFISDETVEQIVYQVCESRQRNVEMIATLDSEGNITNLYNPNDV